jgi:PAS domain S-box-containing protein
VRHTEADVNKDSLILDAVFAGATTAILILDPDRRVVRFNEPCLGLWGVDREFLAARPRIEELLRSACERGVLPSAQADTLVAQYLDHLRKASADAPLETPRTDGAVIEGRATRIPGVGHLLAYRDVTQQTRTAQALDESEQKFRLLFEKSPDPCLLLEDLRVVDCNEEALRILGYSRKEELLGLLPSDFSPERQPDGRLSTEKADAIWAATLHASQLFEWVHRKSDGREFWVEVSLTALPFGDRQVVYTIWRDITERKKAEEERGRLATAVEQVAEAIAVTDARGAVCYANPAFEAITGHPRSEALGQELRALKGQDRGESHLEGPWEAVARGEMWRGRLVGQRTDGRVYEEETTVSPVRDEAGRVVYFVWVSRDVTEQVRLERQVRQTQKLEALGTLAGGIAHDFNNTLMPIIGYAQLTFDDLPEGSEGRENLSRVLSAAQRARDLVGQILAFSRRSDQKLLPIHVTPLVKETLKLLRASLPTTVEIRQVLASSADTVLADPTQIHQVVLNLCTNAGQAMRERGGALTVSLDDVVIDSDFAARHPSLREGPCLRLTVSDTGPGMTREVMERIFEPFFTTKGPGEGTGLGLSVVDGIVKSHGGAISVYSESGQGTTFQVFLPLTKAAAEAEAAPEGEVPGGTERLLVVDDEPAIVDLECKVLERLGYRVTGTTSPAEALASFRASPDGFDLLVSDLTMPGLTGVALTEEIRRLRPRLPVVLCTGFSHALPQGTFDALGIRGIVLKPVTARALGLAVRRELDRHSPPEGGSARP